jgi:ABC-type nitrate/sulfonate/bicarbonate transport system substrate-binding protein
MKPRAIRIGIIAALLLASMALSACTPGLFGPAERVILSLDGAPTTSHAGIYVAIERGWYAAEGVDLTLELAADHAAVLARAAAVSPVSFGVISQDRAILARASGAPLVSIAAIAQDSSLALVATASSGITDVSGLEGKVFASSGAPQERAALQNAMQCAGADGQRVRIVDVGADTLAALATGQADAALLSLDWDAVRAELTGVSLNVIPLSGKCLPIAYGPVIVASERALHDKPDLARRFLFATTRGYLAAAADPEIAALILLKHAPQSDRELVMASQQRISPHYQGQSPRWGAQEAYSWATWIGWMRASDLLSTQISPADMFSNEYLPR